jgi:transposase
LSITSVWRLADDRRQAWRRNHRYASIICNLERRRVVTLLPDREPATAQAWLAAHPTIAIVARDRGGGYGEAAARALPHAVQVADRWHLMENASRAFLDAVRKSMRQIRSAIGATTIDPKLLTAAERLQYEGYLRREEANPPRRRAGHATPGVRHRCGRWRRSWP